MADIDIYPVPGIPGSPGAVIGYAQRTSDQLTIGTSLTDIGGLSVPITVAANRTLRISAFTLAYGFSDSTYAELQIQEDGGRIGLAQNYSAAGGVMTMICSTIRNPAPGSHTYKVQIKANTGTISVGANAQYPTYLLIEDLTGLVGALAPTAAFPARMGWHVTRAANQSIPQNALTDISWDTEVQDTPNNFTAPATTLTIPSGGDGMWQITCQMTFAAVADTNSTLLLRLVAGGMTFQQSDSDDVATGLPAGLELSPIVPLVGGDTIVARTQHAANAAQNITGRLLAYRIGA